MVEKRFTKMQKFEDIRALLTGEPTKYEVTLDIALNFIDHEIEMLNKKKASSTSKMTSVQKENEEFKALIIDYLRILPEDSKGATCTEIFKMIPELSAYSSQKVQPLVKALKEANMITSETFKGRVFYKLKEE